MLDRKCVTYHLVMSAILLNFCTIVAKRNINSLAWHGLPSTIATVFDPGPRMVEMSDLIVIVSAAGTPVAAVFHLLSAVAACSDAARATSSIALQRVGCHEETFGCGWGCVSQTVRPVHRTHVLSHSIMDR